MLNGLMREMTGAQALVGLEPSQVAGICKRFSLDPGAGLAGATA
jgi:hypothetical protein